MSELGSLSVGPGGKTLGETSETKGPEGAQKNAGADGPPALIHRRISAPKTSRLGRFYCGLRAWLHGYWGRKAFKDGQRLMWESGRPADGVRRLHEAYRQFRKASQRYRDAEGEDNRVRMIRRAAATVSEIRTLVLKIPNKPITLTLDQKAAITATAIKAHMSAGEDALARGEPDEASDCFRDTASMALNSRDYLKTRFSEAVDIVEQFCRKSAQAALDGKDGPGQAARRLTVQVRRACVSGGECKRKQSRPVASDFDAHRGCSEAGQICGGDARMP